VEDNGSTTRHIGKDEGDSGCRVAVRGRMSVLGALV